MSDVKGLKRTQSPEEKNFKKVKKKPRKRNNSLKTNTKQQNAESPMLSDDGDGKTGNRVLNSIISSSSDSELNEDEHFESSNINNVDKNNPTPRKSLIDPDTIINATLNLSYPYTDHIPNDATKLHLTSTDPQVKLTSLNPIRLSNAINNLADPIEKIQYLKSGNLFIFCKNNKQLNDLLPIKTLVIESKTIEIKFSLAIADQICQGRI